MQAVRKKEVKRLGLIQALCFSVYGEHGCFCFVFVFASVFEAAV